MNRVTTDKRIVYAKTGKVDSNKIRKALFVNLRPLDMYALIQKIFQVCRSSVVNK